MDIIPNIQIIQGQRKSVQLMFAKFAYAKNNQRGNTIYWNCRSRRNGKHPCNARLSISRLPNGLYKVCLSQPEHNHPPSKRLCRKYD
ncbi:uncharacterized protein LOC128266157 [Drosophila gunungcola]|nr:uncharacterized protein LOC108141039 isoform X2 [Drosophila elegans]XP_017119658.1 uncharacterized protein LOC108141039 isoform X2 [Drosophila elegans]XP_052858439.1 uncharacterized protein LOC128266157 [Drosophila gunungcola]